MEQHQCPICLARFNTGAILLHKRLAQTLEPKTVTGLEPCSECKGRLDEGFIALIEAKDNAARTRTGRIAWLKERAWVEVMLAPVPPKHICYVDEQVLDKLQSMEAPS
jgi:hypothetical protein